MTSTLAPPPGSTTNAGPVPVRRTSARTTVFACLAMLVSYLPFSAVNGALGTIGAATGAGTADLQWFTSAFALALAATVLTAGVVGDLVGRRTVTTVGLGLTAVCAVTAFVAGLLDGSAAIVVLWIAQALGGFGGGAVMSATLGLVTAAAPDHAARHRAIAAWAAAVTVGLGGGPFLAGAFTSWADWHWMFVPILVLAVAVATFGNRCSLEFAFPEGRRLDVGGQLTSAIGVAALVFAVIHGGASGWSNAVTIVALALAVVGVAAFIAVEHHTASPLMRLDLFRSRHFVAAGLAAAVTLFSIVGVVFTLSLLFAHEGDSGVQIAVRLGCMFLFNALASLFSHRFQARYGFPAVLVAGLVLAAVGTGLLVTTASDAGFLDYSWRLAIAGIGGGLVMATASALAVSTTPAHLHGMAGAANNGLRQTGAALGAAVLGSVLAGRLATGASFPAAAHYCAGLLGALLAVSAVVCAGLLARRTS